MKILKNNLTTLELLQTDNLEIRKNWPQIQNIGHLLRIYFDFSRNAYNTRLFLAARRFFLYFANNILDVKQFPKASFSQSILNCSLIAFRLVEFQSPYVLVIQFKCYFIAFAYKVFFLLSFFRPPKQPSKGDIIQVRRYGWN